MILLIFTLRGGYNINLLGEIKISLVKFIILQGIIKDY